MDMCALRYDFQARKLLQSAKNISTARCRNAVLLSARAAYGMNSGEGTPEELLKALIVDLAAARQVVL